MNVQLLSTLQLTTIAWFGRISNQAGRLFTCTAVIFEQNQTANEPCGKVGQTDGDIECHERLGGMLRYYHRAAE